MFRPIILLFPALITLLSGCANLSGKAVEGTRINYNVAIQKTADQQLLLNLVRLRYRDTPYFIEISSISSQLSYRANANANTTLGPDVDNVGIGAGVQYTETPTISYAPLQGDEFVTRVLSPISLEQLILLSNSGWSLSRIMRVCVQRINNLKNAPSASGVTPDLAPVYRDFNNLTGLLRTLQQQDALSLGYEVRNKQTIPVLRLDAAAGDVRTVKNVRQALNLHQSDTYELVNTPVNNRNNIIQINTRSLLGVLYYLSQSTDVPQSHKDSGKVTITKYKDGRLFDWHDVTRDLFRIQHSVTPPTQAAIAIFYRGYWFYIDDADLESKSTFSFLSQLFALQAGKTESIKPVLTLPVGQ